MNILLPEFDVLRGQEWRLRRHQLLNGGGDIRREEQKEWEILARNEVSTSLLLTAVEEHQRLCAAGGLLKDDRKRRISRVNIGDSQTLIVKEYRHVFWLKCLSPDQRSWLGTMRIFGGGGEEGGQASSLSLKTPLSPPLAAGRGDKPNGQDARPPHTFSPLGWLRHKSPRVGYLVMEDAGPEDLMLRETSPHYRQAVPLFAGAGKTLARLHRAGIYHADCKASNFVVREEPDGSLRLSLIDCDDVRVVSSLSPDRAIKNLAQFLGIHWHITDEELRTKASCAFLDAYFAEAPWPTLPRVKEKILAHIRVLYPTKPIEVMERILAQWEETR